jgi:hypothetical protein
MEVLVPTAAKAPQMAPSLRELPDPILRDLRKHDMKRVPLQLQQAFLTRALRFGAKNPPGTQCPTLLITGPPPLPNRQLMCGVGPVGQPDALHQAEASAKPRREVGRAGVAIPLAHDAHAVAAVGPRHISLGVRTHVLERVRLKQDWDENIALPSPCLLVNGKKGAGGQED